MTRLVTALQSVGVDGKVELGGRWITITCERCLVYVIQAGYDEGYYTWCDTPDARTVQFYHDPIEAINAGLQRAASRLRTNRDGVKPKQAA